MFIEIEIQYLLILYQITVVMLHGSETWCLGGKKVDNLEKDRKSYGEGNVWSETNGEKVN